MATTSSAANTVPALEPAVFAGLDDHALMAAVQDGSDEAFASFYERHKPGVLSFCRHILGNREDAEDAVQHTFLATYRHVQSEGPPAHPSAWLYRVARNRCLTMIRARHESPSDAIEPATAGLAEEVEWRFELRALLRDLSRLPEEQRAALILFELGGLNQTEIGEVLESSPDKVKALVYQARHGLLDRAAARETECREIRRRLSTLRGGRLNDRTLKHHLDACAACRAFRADVTLQRRGLAFLLPVVPLADFHAHILAVLGVGGATGGAVAGAAHGAASGSSHLASHTTAAKVVAVGVAATAASAALALALSGHNARRVVDKPTAAPVTAAARPQPAPQAVHHAAASRRTKRRPRARPRATAAARRPAPVVAVVAPAVPAPTPPAATTPQRSPRQPPASPPKPKPKPKPVTTVPVASPPPAQPPPTAPVASPPEPVPNPVVSPTPVVPPPTPTPPTANGHKNGPPGPVGNPQPHGPPPGWDRTH